MSKIERITRLRHAGVMRDFRWPADLPTFARFNLIYGWNGSGKTTLSRLFRHLEQRSVPAAEQVTFCIDGADVEGENFPQANVEIRVFNRDFVEESVFPVGGGDVPPIFVVGRESVEKQKEVDHLRSENAGKEGDLDRARKNFSQAERDEDKYCIDQAKAIKDRLRVPGTGAYNEYDKRAYRQQAQQMVEAGDSSSYVLKEADLDQLLLQHRAQSKAKVPEVSFRLPSLEHLHEEVVATLATTVASLAIEALKSDPPLGEWSRRGLALHKERESVACLFCEQPLSRSRLAALEAHFSSEYDDFRGEVNDLIIRLRKTTRQIGEVRTPDRAALYEDLTADYDSTQELLTQTFQTACRHLDLLVEALEEKKGQPFKVLAPITEVPNIDVDAIKRLNEVIQRHNGACDDFHSRTATARKRLALDMIAGSAEEFSRLVEKKKTAAETATRLEREVKDLAGRIVSLEREILEHQQPAEELTDDLRKYLGHDELRLEVRELGYALMRNGRPAVALSEGEKTALALLYFLKSLRDRSFDLCNGVVVLDDPVSSLDANALYLAFGFIKHRTQDAAQLFLLTHNFTLFRQVRNWFHHEKGQNKRDINQRPARFYMLERVRGADPRCTTIRPLDPLLEQYESEYHYLFARVHRESHSDADARLEQNYALPNIARRLLEMFLAFRRPQIAGELWRKLKDVDFDEARKVRIARFVHTHSHGDTIGEPEHDPSLLGEAGSVLVDLLELIRTEDRPHYEAMVTLIAPATADEDSE